MGKLIRDMTPEERQAMIHRVADQLQAELQANADAIGSAMDEAELEEADLTIGCRDDWHDTCPRCRACGMHRHVGACPEPSREIVL